MDYANRTEAEARLARAISRLSASQRRRLLEIMGNPPKLENVGPEYWDGHFTAWQGVVTPELERIFLDSAELLLDDLPGLGVDWALVNQDAADWARRYGGNLVRDIDQVTRRGVREAVADYYEQGLTMGQLREKLGRWYGPQRASMIATTEVTRASVAGERGVQMELAAEGIHMVERWQTNNDELVCPICGPRHDKVRGDGWTEADGPPAHPNCRCWVTHEIKQAEEEAGRGVSNITFSIARASTEEEIAETGSLFVSGEGAGWGRGEQEIAERAAAELRNLDPFTDSLNLVRVSGNVDFVAMSGRDGTIWLSDTFFNDFYSGTLDRQFGGRSGVLAHELGHQLQDAMTPEESRWWSEMWADLRDDWREAHRAGTLGFADDFSNIDEITLNHWPSYQSMNGWPEDLAESYRVFLGSGGETGTLGERVRIIEAILQRIVK